MISNKDLANEVATTLIAVSAQISETVALVKERGTDEELRHYRRIAGAIMGAIFLEALTPIFKRHPELTPPQLNVPRAT